MNPVGVASSPACEEGVVEALGWHGTLLDGVRVLDTELTVVITAGEDRQPTLGGALVPVRGSWRQALSIARAFLAFAPVALVLPEPPSELCLLECGYADVGIVVDGNVVLPARSRRPVPTTRRTMDRALWRELDRVLSGASSAR
ncbi:hypothetical protein [Cryptosporangium aurantiacum]|uniref:Uncharacterized protein n=1 Tax=Cryptosporangium aurantiacum TaxID=134849 RepID=A0A1M7MU52_9ACTN|nr:hypothetical protein [Cryptosporangium aurantiacum]SHM94628.1 hypothetical protein SAMN05443668_102273 [Cryptosporangium aurantiacum]